MKTYIVENRDTGWWCKLEIDLPKAEAPIKEMVEFWSGWETRLALNDGDYVETWLKHFASVAESQSPGAAAIREYFRGLEGWYPLDGSKGIKFIEVEGPDDSDPTDYRVREYSPGDLE